MWKKRNYQLTDEEVEIIERAMLHDKRPEARQKAQAIHLLHLGQKVTSVAEMMAVTRTTIYEWHDAWLANGIDGLVRKKGSGRRFKASPAYEQLLEETVDTDPAELGYEFTVWTVDRLCQHMLEKTGILLSGRTLTNTLRRLDYVYRRPKRDLSYLHDPEVMAQAEEHLEMLKKRPESKPLSSSLWMKQQ